MKMNMMTETTFSHDSDLEEAVIGACMIERAAMPLVADKLRPEMFYEEKNLEIFAALQSMYRSAKSIDTITLKNELAARGKLDAVGGPYELLRISSKVSSSAHLEYHALILRQLHTRRIMRTEFQQLLAFSADESMDIDDILVEAHRLLEGLEDESGVADHLRSIDRLMDDTLAEVEQRVEDFLAAHPYLSREEVPSEMVTASGSGLDPDISPRGAEVQVRRVAQARGLDEGVVRSLVDSLTQRPWLGLFGTEKVNVLRLNIALEKLQPNVTLEHK